MLRILSMMFVIVFSIVPCLAETYNIVTSSVAGGGADLQARVLAKHLVNHLPKDSSVNVISMQGAGGLTLANWMYNVAEPDKNIALLNVNNDVIFKGIMKDSSAKYDLTKFNWLFSAEDGDDNVFVLWANTSRGLDNVSKLKVDNEFVIGNQGPNNIQSYILEDIVGSKSKIIFGYKDIIRALQVNEIDARFGTLLNAKARYPRWINGTDEIRPILQVGSKRRHQLLPNIPNAREFVNTPKQDKILDYYEKNVRLARLIFSSPKMSPEKIKMFVDAAVKLEKDPDFIEDAKKLEMGVDFIHYVELKPLIKEIISTDKELLKELIK